MSNFSLRHSLFDIRYSLNHADPRTIGPEESPGDLRTSSGHSRRVPWLDADGTLSVRITLNG